MVTGYSFDDRQWGNVIAWCGVVWPFDRRCCTSVCDKTDNPIETDNTGRHRRQNAANRKSLNKTKVVVQPTDSRHVAKSKTHQRILEQNLQGKETLCFPKVDFNFQHESAFPAQILSILRLNLFLKVFNSPHSRGDLTIFLCYSNKLDLLLFLAFCSVTTYRHWPFATEFCVLLRNFVLTHFLLRVLRK